MLFSENSAMRVEHRVNLKPLNSFGLPATAANLVRITHEADLRQVIDDPVLGPAPKLVLGGGTNVILTQDPAACVLKMDIAGRRLVHEDAQGIVVEAGAGEGWHDVVAWTLDQGWGGLENLALIPGTVGAAPVQNIGAYGLELKDRLESLDVIDLTTGRKATLNAAQCRFDYRDSIFKHELAGKSVITRVRLRLPKPWQPVWAIWTWSARWPRPASLRPAPGRFSIGCAPSDVPSCPTPRIWAMWAASSRTRWSAPSNARTSSAATRKSSTIPCPTAM
jgi:UDP-N-acetylmuramate dehydrogenase